MEKGKALFASFLLPSVATCTFAAREPFWFDGFEDYPSGFPDRRAGALGDLESESRC